MRIYLGSDHAGFELKGQIKSYLIEQGFDTEDMGAHVYDENDDYPDLIKITAVRVAQDKESMGIVFGKSGAGEVIVANKINGIRAVLAMNNENIKLSREHNDANMLAFGADFVTADSAKNMTKLFLNTRFSEDTRHKRRIEKIKEIESNNS